MFKNGVHSTWIRNDVYSNRWRHYCINPLCDCSLHFGSGGIMKMFILSISSTPLYIHTPAVFVCVQFFFLVHFNCLEESWKTVKYIWRKHIVSRISCDKFSRVSDAISLTEKIDNQEFKFYIFYLNKEQFTF